MCRARPGPRCSHGGRIRIARARRWYNTIYERYQRQLAEGRLTARTRRQFSRASLRLNAAQAVYWATPEGQNELREKIERDTEALYARFPSDPPEEGTSAHMRYTRMVNVIERSRKRLEEGITRRAESYKDLALVRAERTELRRQATARGGRISKNAQPLSVENAARIREGMERAGLPLREWTSEDVARAGSWVERGADPGFVANSSVRPFVSARDEDGVMVRAGSTAEVAESRLLRMNMPDGTLVESRTDMFVSQNADGKYVVGAKIRTASSWEDVSPIDEAKQDLGHLISRNNVGRSEAKFVVGVASSREEAVQMMERAKQDFDAPKVSALMARDALTSRAARRNVPLQRRGWVVWQRYVDPAGQATAQA